MRPTLHHGKLNQKPEAWRAPSGLDLAALVAASVVIFNEWRRKMRIATPPAVIAKPTTVAAAALARPPHGLATRVVRRRRRLWRCQLAASGNGAAG